MTITTPLLWFAFGLFLGTLVVWFFREREIVALGTGLAEEKVRCAELVAQLSRAQSDVGDVRCALAAANERAGTLQQTEERMRGEFAMLAQGALDNASSRFLDLATVRLAPLRDEFGKFASAVDALKTNSAQELGALKASLHDLARMQTSLQDAVRTTNDATGRLRDALQNPRVAGNWGEISLDRIVELAGMSEHVDFDRQTGMRSSDGTQERPDLTIHLTGGLNIPVDAKASTANYVKAVGETNESERERLLAQSATDLRARIAELRGRGYGKIDGYAGMTILYVPNEAMLSSALARDPDLIEDALRHQMMICSPLLLLCYLRAFAHGWRLQKQQENAEEVARRGRMLYERLQSFFSAIGKVGWYLNHTVEKFNIAVGKMDNLLVPGRELGKLLGITGDPESVDPIASVARDVRFKDAGANGNGAATALPNELG